MSHEIEAAAGASLGGFFRPRRHNDAEFEPGTPCANCGTPLQGPWCYKCGQLGEDYHRSIWKLILEVFEGLLHFDGRVWTTLPDLFRRPGRLTRSYLDGHRAPQVPPFRLFLVVLVVIFLAGSIGGRKLAPGTVTQKVDAHGNIVTFKTTSIEDMKPEERARLVAEMDKETAQLATQKGGYVPVWLEKRGIKVLQDPERFKLVLEQWAERFAFLLLPLAAGLLSLVFVFQRRFFVFDHTVFSLHSLSANGLIFALAELFSGVTGGGSYLILWATPVHLFVHMRGTYKTSIIGTLLRMFILFIGSTLGATMIFVALILVGLNGMGA
jgi:hypothetical protein